jgi:hypothetical protein
MRIWTDEQKQKQREAIKRWQPWVKSTGPRTDSGKRTSSQNAYKHGRFSAGSRAHRKTLRIILRHARAVIAWGRFYRKRQRHMIIAVQEKARKLQNELLSTWRKHTAFSPTPAAEKMLIWPPPRIKMAA